MELKILGSQVNKPMAGQASIENGKKGGRPKGSLNKATIEKKEAEKQFIDRVVKSVDRLFNAQISIAEGCSYLYRIEETGEGKNKSRKHVLVTSPEEIQAYLDGEVDEDDYYYITTHAPDNKAIDSLMDRAFGKARQTIGLDGGEKGKPIPLLANLNVSNNDSSEKDKPDDKADQGSARRDIGGENNSDRSDIDRRGSEGRDTHPDQHSLGVSATPEAGSDSRLHEDHEAAGVLEGQ